jgi:hypothetical protein
MIISSFRILKSSQLERQMNMGTVGAGFSMSLDGFIVVK